jgi:4-amino-4-deoxy-L-arabinose transferase-like glycosyltransferase
MLKFNFNNKTLFFLVFILGVFLRYLFFNNLDSWFDEWNMLYTVDPNIDNKKTWERFYGDRGAGGFLPEYYPPINAFLLKYFLKITNYYAENARIYSLIFGTLSLVASYLLAIKITDKKNAIISIVLIAGNFFLIQQSSEIRPHSLVLFISLMSIIFFIKILNNNLKSITLILTYIIISIFLLSSWPFSLTIFFGKCIYILLNLEHFKKKLITLTLILFFIIVFYLIINREYLIYMLSKKEHYTQLFYGFFYSYHFRSFFGSIALGAFFLLTFAYLILNYFKKLKKSILLKYDFLILIIILSTYMLTIIYSIIRAGVISPKYVIFILPLIIIWIVSSSNNLNQKIKNYYLSFLIFFNYLNLILNFYNTPIQRPELNKALIAVSNSANFDILINEDTVVTNAIKTSKKLNENNLKLLDIKEIKESNINIFWFLCLNNPRFAHGNQMRPVEEKCNILENNPDFKEISNVNIKDFILKKYKKIDKIF